MKINYYFIFIVIFFYVLCGPSGVDFIDGIRFAGTREECIKFVKFVDGRCAQVGGLFKGRPDPTLPRNMCSMESCTIMKPTRSAWDLGFYKKCRAIAIVT